MARRDKENVFDGSDMERRCRTAIYECLMTGEWVTIRMMLARCMEKPLDYYDNVKLSAPQSPFEDAYHREIKKSVNVVVKALESIEPGCVEDNGLKKGKARRYMGKNKTPLDGMLNALAIRDIGVYWQFCQDTAGLLPTVWLEHFFRNTTDLFKIKTRKNQGELIIKASVDRKLNNIELLPILYEKIKQKKIIRFYYEPYTDERKEHIVHPQFLHEFEGRWQLLGHEDGCEYDPVIFSLDRIRGDIYDVEGEYKKRENGFFIEYFKYQIGASRMVAEPIHIRVRAHNKLMYGLTRSKPIHFPFEEIKQFGEHEDGEYGEFEYYLCPNEEFYSRIMRMGKGLEVVSPPEIREEIARRLRAAAALYD